MHEEVEQAFARAKELDDATSLAHAQASLTHYLSTTSGTPSTELDSSQIASLQEKIADTDETLTALPIDSRYDAMVLAQTTETQRNSFDWDLADNSANTEDREGTRTSERNGEGDAAAAEVRRTAVDQGAMGEQDLRDAEVADVPISTDGPDHVTRMANAGGGQDTRPLDAEGSARTATVVAGQETAPVTSEQRMGSGTTADPAPGAPGTTTAATIPSTAQDRIFLLENDMAEAMQLRDAARTRTRRDSLDARIASLGQQIAAENNVAQQVLEPAAEPGNTLDEAPLMTMEAIAFDKSASEPQIVEALYATFDEDRSRIAAIPDLDERNASLNGLELMLVDSITAQTNAQLADLESHPERASEILPRVDRLRMMKESHLNTADEVLAASQRTVPRQEDDMQDELLVSAQTAVGQPRAMVDPSAEDNRYVEVEPDPQMIYASKLEHRSPEASEAAKTNAGTLEEISGLTTTIDSLERTLDEMPQGKAYDKLRQKIDRMIDDRLILRAEMGQRMEFVSREEFKAGMDSLKTVRLEVVKAGLAPSEPVMVMARQMEETAQQRFNEALQLRKRADRTEDIVLRDSLFRQAYAAELVALRELDRAITVNNYVLDERFQKGTSPSYATIEGELFGLPEVAAVDASSIGSLEEQGSDVTPSAINAGSIVRQQAGEEHGSTSPAVGTSPSVTVHEQVDLRAPASERSRELYGAYIVHDQQQTTTLMKEADPGQLALQARMADVRAHELEDRSLALADKAVAVNDSAANVKKRDREAVQQEAVRLQQVSDSLHAASLAHADSARIFEQLARDAEQVRLYEEGLRKYYYLNGEEQALVRNDADHSRYFQARVKALQQQEESMAASHAASSTRELAAALHQEAGALLSGANGTAPNAEAQQKATTLEQRAAQLDHRADSLDKVAARLSSARI